MSPVELYKLVQKMFLTSEHFDIGMVYMIRNLTKNFIEDNRGKSMNDLPIELAAVVEENPNAKTLEDYIKNILTKMNEDAQGFLLYVVPIALRINIFIVNIDTSIKARVNILLMFDIVIGG